MLYNYLIPTLLFSSGRTTEARGHEPGQQHSDSRPHSEGEPGYHRPVQSQGETVPGTSGGRAGCGAALHINAPQGLILVWIPSISSWSLTISPITARGGT